MVDQPLLTLTVEALTQLITPLLYLLAGGIVAAWLGKSLSRQAKVLAGLMFCAQLIALGMALYIEAPSSFIHWLWDPHQEWNIPAILASTQLALAAAVALLAAWSAARAPRYLRLYLAGIGLALFLLALDEFFTFHENLRWSYYIAAGFAIVAATLLVAALSPRQLWKWHGAFLLGLGISALGGIHIEPFGAFCGNYGLLTVVDCPQATIWALEEVLEFLGIWLVLVALCGQLSALASPSRRARLALYLVSALWVALILPAAQIWPLSRQANADPADLHFASGARLYAYRVKNHAQHLELSLILSPAQWNFDGLGYSLSLVDQVSKDRIAGDDFFAHSRSTFYLAPGYRPAYKQWAQLAYPADISRNRAYWVVLSLWREQNGTFTPERILKSDHYLLSDTQVLLEEFLKRASASTASGGQPIARFAKGFTLAAIDMPAQSTPGAHLPITLHWRVEADGRASSSEDYGQFLHMQHIESGEWFVYNQLPLGPRLPTRLWYSGLDDSETWQVPLPAELAPGGYAISTGLYRNSDKERLPAHDAQGSPFTDARIPLGTITLQPASS